MRVRVCDSDRAMCFVQACAFSEGSWIQFEIVQDICRRRQDILKIDWDIMCQENLVAWDAVERVYCSPYCLIDLRGGPCQFWAKQIDTDDCT